MGENYYRREPSSDVVDIYTGLDENRLNSLFVKMKNKPSISLQSSLLTTRVTQRSDKQWAFQVSLTNDKYLSVFKVLVSDLVSIVSKETIQMVAERKLVQRYSEWERLFEVAKDKLLSPSQIQGLVGELYFINFKLFPVYGVEATIESWTGPDASNLDFSFSENWFEVKTKSINSHEVTISNENQLQSSREGYLTVISCERTSELSKSSFNLMSLYNLIVEKIENHNIRLTFFEKLAQLGFIPSSDYKDYSYTISGTEYYLVSQNFPKVSIPEDGSISQVKYKLNLPMLSGFRREEETWKNIEKN